MGIFDYKAPSQGGSRLGFGIHKLRVTEVNVKRASNGAGFNVSCTVESEKGATSKFVSLGYYYDIQDSVQFEKAKKNFDEVKSMNRAAYAENDAVAKELATKQANTFRDSVSGDIHYKLVDSLTNLANFVSGFSSEAREAVANVDVDSIEQLLTAYGNILKTSGYAYVFLYESTTVSKDGSKTYQNVNLSQNFQAPRSFAVNQVKEVVPEFKTKDDEKVLVGYKVIFLTGKSASLALNDKTYQGNGVKPNDNVNEDKADDLPNVEADDLPF